MQIILLIVLVVMTASAIAKGFAPIAILTGIGIYLIATSTKSDQHINSFFAICFLGGIAVVAYETAMLLFG